MQTAKSCRNERVFQNRAASLIALMAITLAMFACGVPPASEAHAYQACNASTDNAACADGTICGPDLGMCSASCDPHGGGRECPAIDGYPVGCLPSNGSPMRHSGRPRVPCSVSMGPRHIARRGRGARRRISSPTWPRRMVPARVLIEGPRHVRIRRAASGTVLAFLRNRRNCPPGDDISLSIFRPNVPPIRPRHTNGNSSGSHGLSRR